MWADRESGARVVADLIADATLTPRQRCQILKSITLQNPELKPEAAAGHCYQAP